MIKQNRKTIIYTLLIIFVIGIVYLWFQGGTQEGFATPLKKDSSSTATNLVYFAKVPSIAQKDKDLEIPGADLAGKIINDFFVEYKAKDGKFYKAAVCGSGPVTTGSKVTYGQTTQDIGGIQAAPNFDLPGSSTKPQVVFKADTSKRLHSSFYKTSKNIANSIIRDCPPFFAISTNPSSLSAPDSKFSNTNEIVVPYDTKKKDSLIKGQGLVFQRILDAALFGGATSTNNTAIDVSGTSNNLKITIIVA